MATPTTTPDRAEVSLAMETFIDHHNVSQLLDLVAAICFDKAEHIRANWQDNNTARPWDRGAKLLDSLAARIEV